ncbi:unnamed protein product [Diplocarpon coronariae]
MATQMASSRQPFAPLTSSRLHNLTSLKNRQNALSSPSKRKATIFDDDNDAENIDPVAFLSPKRAKQSDGTHAASPRDALCKPANYLLTRAPPPPGFSSVKTTAAPTPPRRATLIARPPAASRIETRVPLSAPAGRSPTRKRIGILNRRKTASPFTRVDPPRFSSSSSGLGVGFSIDAALSGTIPSYSSRQAPAAATPAPAPFTAPQELAIPVLHTEVARESWFFEIHEDTEEELATNLMEHGACTLDISSDEESAARERESRGKENVPPGDDVSQTRLAHSVPAVEGAAETKRSKQGRTLNENMIELDRAPLGDLAAEDFYAEGCDGSAVVLVAEDEQAQEPEQGQVQEHVPEDVGAASTFDLVAEPVRQGKAVEADICVEALMAKTGEASQAKLLEPVEKVEEGWSVWESGSAQGDD